jgi:hypothetical protein
MSDVLLFTVTLAVTALAVLGSWAAYRRRGPASGMRGAAWSAVPMAAYLTGLTKFLSDLVFSPVKWAGVVLFGLAALLYVTSGVMLRRTTRLEDGPRRKSAPAGPAPTAAIEKRKPATDPDVAEIEQILKNRGIS